MKNIRPLIVTFEPGIELWQKEAVREAILEIIELAGISSKLSIIEDDSINNYLIKELVKERKGQINADTLMEFLNEEIIPLQFSPDEIYYKLIILKRDMYSSGTNFVIGLAQELIGSVISINRFLKLGHQNQLNCIKTETIHEIGHVFGLVPESRKIMVEESLGKHCKNCCTMRQGLTVPEDWVQISNDRIKYGVFCDTCLEDLRSFFADE